jgi:RND superfamily putative drug exporter
LQIFLSLRIIEFRERGHSDVDSIKLGFAATAGTITTAGVIMVIAFGCLMISSQQLLVEAGFFIAFSILFDTFVVRTIIVPCVMVVLGPANWWPRKMVAVDAPRTGGYDALYANDNGRFAF